MHSRFIVFEGLDGSGKDTVLTRIFPYLFGEDIYSPLFINKFQNVLRTREPTNNSAFGKEIISLLTGDNMMKKDCHEIASLYIKDRKEHCKSIKSHIEQNTVVLCSRYDLSTFSYQMAMGCDFDLLYEEHKYGTNNGCLIPDITLYFKIPVESTLKRIEQRGKEAEALEAEPILRRTLECYDYIITRLRDIDGRHIEIIDADQPRDMVFAETIKVLNNY